MLARLLIIATTLIAAQTPASPNPLWFYYTSNRQGEIEPCGCPVNQVGGLARMATFLSTEKEKGRVGFIGDAGDTFFSNATLVPTRRDNERGHARVIARAYRLFGLDALTPGERDFADGIDALRELKKLSGAAFVSANLVDEKGAALFPPYAVIPKAGLRIAVLGVADETAFGHFPGIKTLPSFSAVAETLKKISVEKPDVVVLLSHLGLPKDRELARAGGIDLIIGSHSLDSLDKAERIGNTPVVQPAYQGQQLGALEFLPEKHQWGEDRVVTMDSRWDKPNEVARWIQEVKDNSRAVAQKVVEQLEPPEKAFVAHAGECRKCHQKQHDFWETTKHASAYLVLYSKNQHFDPECIGCHSLGFEDPRGYKSIVSPIKLVGAGKRKKGEAPFVETLMSTVFADDGPRRPLDSRTEPERFAKLKDRYHGEIHKLDAGRKIEKLYAGVQCENCHGNMNGHPTNGVRVQKVVEATCRACHRPPEAPTFDFAMVKAVGCPKN